MSQRAIDLQPYGGSPRVVWGMIAANAAVIAAAAVTHTAMGQAGIPQPLRIGGTVLAGLLVTIAIVAAHRRRLRKTAASLVLTDTSMQIYPRRGPTREIRLATLKVRRLAYLMYQGSHPDHDHVMVLDLQAPPSFRLRICGRGVRGTWPQHEGEARIPPELEVTSDDWTILCRYLEAAGALPTTTEPPRLRPSAI